MTSLRFVEDIFHKIALGSLDFNPTQKDKFDRFETFYFGASDRINEITGGIILHVEPMNTQMSISRGSIKVEEITLNITVGIQNRLDELSDLDTISDSAEILKGIIIFLNTHPFYKSIKLSVTSVGNIFHRFDRLSSKSNTANVAVTLRFPLSSCSANVPVIQNKIK